jgi:hypothetical protein
MEWSWIPVDLEEGILAKLSFGELACIADMRRSIRSVFRRRLAQEEEARHSLVDDWLGYRRVACIGALIIRFFKGEVVDPNLVANVTTACRISSVGVLEVLGPASHHTRRLRGCEPTQIHLRIKLRTDAPVMHLCVPAPNQSDVELHVFREPKRVLVNLRPQNEEDVEGSAFVRALLTFGLGPRCDVADLNALGPAFDAFYLNAEVRIGASSPKNDSSKLTQAGIRTQILPLVRLVEQHANWWIEPAGAWRGVRVRPFLRTHVFAVYLQQLRICSKGVLLLACCPMRYFMNCPTLGSPQLFISGVNTILPLGCVKLF